MELPVAARPAQVGVYGWLVVTTTRRPGMVISAVAAGAFLAVVIAALGSLWKVTIPAGHVMAGYSAHQIVWYIAVAETAINCVNQRLMNRLGDDLRSGRITTELLKPITTLWYVAAHEIGRGVIQGLILLPITGAVAWVLVGPPPSWHGMALLLATLPLAMTLQLLMVLGFSASIFWLGDANAAWFVVQKLFFLCGGMILPLEFWPHAAATVLQVLPWAGTAWGPAVVAVHPSAHRALSVVGLQLVWIAVAAWTAALLWRIGLARVMRNGG